MPIRFFWKNNPRNLDNVYIERNKNILKDQAKRKKLLKTGQFAGNFPKTTSFIRVTVSCFGEDDSDSA